MAPQQMSGSAELSLEASESRLSPPDRAFDDRFVRWGHPLVCAWVRAMRAGRLPYKELIALMS